MSRWCRPCLNLFEGERFPDNIVLVAITDRALLQQNAFWIAKGNDFSYTNDAMIRVEDPESKVQYARYFDPTQIALFQQSLVEALSSSVDTDAIAYSQSQTKDLNVLSNLLETLSK